MRALSRFEYICCCVIHFGASHATVVLGTLNSPLNFSLRCRVRAKISNCLEQADKADKCQLAMANNWRIVVGHY